jgi:hypothetical protein
MGSVLEEWLQAVSAAGWSLPHRWLPELLDLSYQKEDIRPLVAPLLGARGRWLALQHPTWKVLFVPRVLSEQEEWWQTGTRKSRQTLLRLLRAEDPARARQLVASTWDQDAYSDRAVFLSTLSIGLGADDEPFLEQALDDRRKQVRVVAADLLARLPASALSARMRERLSPLLALETGLLKRGQLKVALPEDCSKAMARDGVAKKAPAGLDEGAWWLFQMLAVVPPRVWSQSWGRTPEELVTIANKTEYASVLLEGWGRAAARHGDGTWAEALLRLWVDEPWAALPGRKFADRLDALVHVIPRDRLESWLVTLLRVHRRSLDAHHALLTLLQHHRRPWGEGLTRAVLVGSRSLARKQSYPIWRWRSALVGFARYASPALLEEAEQMWWMNEGGWEKEVHRFLAILRFRQAMQQAFAAQ